MQMSKQVHIRLLYSFTLVSLNQPPIPDDMFDQGKTPLLKLGNCFLKLDRQ